MPNLADGVSTHAQKTLKNARAYAEGAAYRCSGTAALRPITGNPEDGLGSEAEAAWDAGWNAADSGTVDGDSANAGAHTFDETPAAFTFTDLTDVVVSTVQVSAPIQVTGLTDGYNVAISVTGGEYSINGGAYTSSAGEVKQGDFVRARHTSSGSAATATDTVVTIGGVSDTFTSTTAA